LEYREVCETVTKGTEVTRSGPEASGNVTLRQKGRKGLGGTLISQPTQCAELQKPKAKLHTGVGPAWGRGSAQPGQVVPPEKGVTFPPNPQEEWGRGQKGAGKWGGEERGIVGRARWERGKNKVQRRTVRKGYWSQKGLSGRCLFSRYQRDPRGENQVTTD